MSVLSATYFHYEEAAYQVVETTLWPHGPVCPRCGSLDRLTPVKGGRIGLNRCGPCKRQFTVKVGTIFESSHVPLHQWLQAVFLMVSSKKGISSHQLMRILDCQYRTAWFMTHRIREAMRSGDLEPFGGHGGTVEVDETFIGNDRTIKPKGQKKGRGYAHKHKVLALVDRESGTARSMVVDDLKTATIAPIVRASVAREARLMTDEAAHYTRVGREFAEHGVVRHGKDEYVRLDDPSVHTNTIEGYFSVFKRGMKGTYQHCAKKHLHRYLAEFDFRYNNRARLGVDDAERASRALRGVVGKRLTYETGIGR